MRHDTSLVAQDSLEILGNDGWKLFPRLLSRSAIESINDWLQGAVVRADTTASLEPEFEPGTADRKGPVRKLRRLFWNDRKFWTSVLAGPFARTAMDLVGPNACLIFHAAFLKAPGGGSATPFHQDPAFWRYRYPSAISMWLALDPTDESNGCMELCPGTHRLPILPHRARADWMHAGIDLDMHGLSAQPVVMQPGDVIAWDKNLVHGSNANQSPNRRWGIVAVIADGSAPDFKAFDSAPLADFSFAVGASASTD